MIMKKTIEATQNNYQSKSTEELLMNYMKRDYAGSFCRVATNIVLNIFLKNIAYPDEHSGIVKSVDKSE